MKRLVGTIRAARTLGPIYLSTVLAANAGDATQWPSKISNALTPMAITMAAVGFVIVGIAHSTTAASDWAQRHEKTALRGAIFSVGASAIVNLIKNIFM